MLRGLPLRRWLAAAGRGSLRTLTEGGLHVGLRLHLVSIEVLVNVDNALSHRRLQLIHEGIGHQSR